jgi:hypothetical protein
MKWFRSNIKHGSRLALLALAIQFVLTFGHFHGVAAEAAPAIQTSQAALVVQSVPAQWDQAHTNGLAAPNSANPSVKPQQPVRDHDSDRQSNDTCAICVVIAMANAVLFATPPLLLVPQAVEFLYVTADAECVHLHATRVAFQPRAPPISRSRLIA